MATYIIKTTLFILLIFLFSCNKNGQRVKNEQIISIEETIASTEEKLQDRFINKKLESVNTILFDGKAVEDKKIILIYTGFDCQSCVDKGYLILKDLQSQNEKLKIYVVATNANIGGDQERNEFYDYIYNDKQELIRMEMKFIYTPVILVLDNDNRIIHLNFPKTNSNEKEIVEEIISHSL